MSRIVLDAGAFIGIDRGDRAVAALLRVIWEEGLPVLSSAAVVAQVWRGGSAQARLARVLAGVDVRALNPEDAKRTGILLARSKTADVVDGHVALLVGGGDRVLTSDPKDIETLLAAREVSATVIRV